MENLCRNFKKNVRGWGMRHARRASATAHSLRGDAAGVAT